MATTKEWKKFNETNSAHDLAKWLLSGDNMQVLRIVLMTEVGGEIDIDASDHECVRAIKARAKMKKAKP